MKSQKSAAATLLIVLWTIALASAASPTNALEDSEMDAFNRALYSKYFSLDDQLKDYTSRGVKRLLPYLMEASGNLNMSASCLRDTYTWLSGVRRLKLWAVNMLDASAKIPEGILLGNAAFLGEFDQCLSVNVHKHNGVLDFQGQYCLLEISIIFPKTKEPVSLEEGFVELKNISKNTTELMQILIKELPIFAYESPKFGVCLPSGCSENDIDQAVKYFGQKNMIEARVHSCQVEGEYNMLNPRNIVIICIYCLFGFVGILSSVIDYYFRWRKIKPGSLLTKVILCFSATKNFQILMDASSRGDSTLFFLHGIKVLTLFHIILSHQHSFLGVFLTTKHFMDLQTFVSRFFSQLVVNGYLSVEVFLLIGGFLHCYSRLSKAKEKTKQPGFLKIIIFRIWRIAPTYLFSMLLIFLFIPRGPYAKAVIERFVQPCVDNWWWNALFISNFCNLEKTCGVHTWYLSVDMQLFLMSVPVVGLLIRSSRKGVNVSAGLVAFGLISTAIIVYFQDSPPMAPLTSLSKELYMKFSVVHAMTFSHIAPYFSGVILGYLVHARKHIKMSKVSQFIGWTAGFLVFVSSLFVTVLWNRGVPYTQLEAGLYVPLGRWGYSLGVAWLIFICASGHGGIVNYILSLKLWVPLSRISYAVYLVSFTLQLFYSTNRRFVTDFKYMTLCWQHIGDIGMSCLLGLVVTLFFECPFFNLQKLAFSDYSKNADLPTTPPAEGIDNEGFKTLEMENQRQRNGNTLPTA